MPLESSIYKEVIRMVRMFTLFYNLQKHYTVRENEAHPYRKKSIYAIMSGICRAIMYLF